jgi:hypothetical protein
MTDTAGAPYATPADQDAALLVEGKTGYGDPPWQEPATIDPATLDYARQALAEQPRASRLAYAVGLIEVYAEQGSARKVLAVVQAVKDIFSDATAPFGETLSDAEVQRLRVRNAASARAEEPPS